MNPFWGSVLQLIREEICDQIVSKKEWREKMGLIEIKCRHCESEKINKLGYSTTGRRRYKCADCQKSFQLEYEYNGADPSISSKTFFLTY